jgi:uncharacterized protein YoxC
MADLIQIGINVQSNADAATRGLDRLEGSVTNNLKTVERLEREYRRLDKAFNSGKISSQLYARGVQQVDRAIEDVWKSTTRATNATRQYSNTQSSAAIAAQNLANAQRMAGKDTNRFGMYAQQVGYQVGDFLVQVQSGTSALVAFGQQGTQLAGLLPGIYGAIIGIGLSLTTALLSLGSTTTELSFNFGKLWEDVKSAFEPMAPLFRAVGETFKFVGGVIVDAANFIINSFAILVNVVGAIPEAFSVALDRAETRIRQFSESVNAVVYSISANWQKMMDTISGSAAPGFLGTIPGEEAATALQDFEFLAESARSRSEALSQSLENSASAVSVLGDAIANTTKIDLRDYLSRTAKAADDAGGSTKELKKELTDAEKAALEFAKAMNDTVIGAVDGVANAFGDFIMRGFKDFKSFTKDILNSFAGMLKQMIVLAARNKIMIGLGASFSGVGGMASAAGGLAGGAGGLLGGIGGALGGLGTGLAGIFTGGGLGASFANLGGLLGGSVSGLGAIGAAIPAIGLVALGFTALIGKTKELDSGLKVTVGNMDALTETFRTIEKSRFFGLSKKTSTKTGGVSNQVSDPIVQAVQSIQQSVLDAAAVFGIAESAFENFSYNFQLSLKGLSEEQKMQKINEELTKMGDSFASLTGIFSSMSELLAVAQERFQLENRLLQLQGNIVELRKQELETVNVLNRGLLARIQLMQAEADLMGALGSFASAISQQQGLIRSAVDALVSPLQNAIDVTRKGAEESYKVFRASADKARDQAKEIVDILTGAISSRTIQSEAVELMRYQQGQRQLARFAGGEAFDAQSLGRATSAVSIDSTKFFGSFEDYARDFYKTQISLTQLAEKAQGELTDVEKQIDIAEKAYQVALGTYTETQDFNTSLNQLLTDLAVYTETAARNQPFIDQIKAEGDRQVELLDQILVETTKQVNALLGVENTIADLVGTNVSVGEALAILGLEGKDLAGAVVALQPVVDAVGSHVAALDLTLSGAIDRLGLSLEDLVTLDLTGPLGDTLLGLGSKFSALDVTTAGLNLGLVGLDGTIGALQSSVNSQAGATLQLDNTIISQNAVVDALSGEVSLLASNVVNLDGTVYGLGSNVIGLGTNVTGLGANVTGLGTNVTGLGTNINDLGMSTNNLGININDLGGTLTNAMSGLGSIVSGLAGAVSGLAASNNALATAQKAQVKAENDIAVASFRSRIESTAAKTVEDNIKRSGLTRSEYFGGKEPSVAPVYEELAIQAEIKKAKDKGVLDVSQVGKMVSDLSRDGADAFYDKYKDVIPTFAAGGMHSGGMRLVGEQGPELEVTGPSRIYNKKDTMDMLSGGNSETAAEIRNLRREVSELRAEQRKIGVENVKYNKKSYDLNREWDIVGLPATRTA